MRLPKIFGVAALAFGAVYGLASQPSNSNAGTPDEKLLVNRSAESSLLGAAIFGPAFGVLAQLHPDIIITSASNDIRIMNIELNRGNCDGTIFVNHRGGNLKEQGLPIDEKKEEERALRLKAEGVPNTGLAGRYHDVLPVDLKFGDKIKVNPKCDVVEMVITTANTVQTFNMKN